MHRAKFLLNFKGLVFLSGYVRLAVPIFIRSSLGVSYTDEGFEVPINSFVCLCS